MPMQGNDPSDDDGEAGAYAQAIVDTVRQPLLVLTNDLRVETANPAFLETFQVARATTEGALVYELGGGQWNIPELRRLLEEVLPRDEEIVDYRLEHAFETPGPRAMLLSARRMEREGRTGRILVGITDVTEAERARRELKAYTEYLEKVFDASREALLVLGLDLEVHAANETFYEKFAVTPPDTIGRPIFALGDGQWDIPELRRLLETVLPHAGSFDDFEVEHEFQRIGRKAMVLNARQVDHLQLILLAIEDVTERRESRAALAESEARLRALVEAAAQDVWEADPAGDLRADAPGWGIETAGGEREASRRTWLEAIHADDRAEAEALWRAAIEQETTFDAEFRLRDPGGGYRWTNLRAAPLRDARARVTKWVGMNLDVDDRRRAEDERELLLAELNHRVKNLLGVIRSLANQGAPGRSAEEYRRVLVGRIDALARAHSLALANEWRGVDLADLARRTLEPYMRSGRTEAVTIAGPTVALSPRATMTLGLVLHELATNATKYGALSAAQGRLVLTWRRETGGDAAGRVRLTWEESGGPTVTPPEQASFGTRMIERVFRHELKGGATLAYRAEGVRLEAWFSPA